MKSLNQLSKMIDKPKNNSKAIIKRAIKGANKKLETPKSTKIISKGSIGYNFAIPEITNVIPTTILSM